MEYDKDLVKIDTEEAYILDSIDYHNDIVRQLKHKLLIYKWKKGDYGEIISDSKPKEEMI